MTAKYNFSIVGHIDSPSQDLLVLVIEDDLALAQTVELCLRKEGYRTERAGDGIRGIELFRVAQPNLIILDLGLPKVNGLEVLRAIRSESNVPVIILTARSEEVDELLGLGLGADNYLIKPVSARKLIAHVNVALRRSQPAPVEPTVFNVGPLEVDMYRREIRAHGVMLDLTPTEFKLLHHLALTPGRAVSRVELLEAALPKHDVYERTVDIHLTNVRRKLRDAAVPDMIETVRGVGYRLHEPA